MSHFKDIDNNPIYSTATLLHPCYKDSFFMYASTLQSAKDQVYCEYDDLIDD